MRYHVKKIISLLRYFFKKGGNSVFANKFNEILNNKQITAYKVAKETGISQGLMNEYKNGIKSPTIQNLVRIADYLDCSVDYLLGRTENPDVNP